MILVVLAVVWVVALTPMVLRKVSERRFTEGLRSYHRLLSRFGSSDHTTVVVERPVASYAAPQLEQLGPDSIAAPAVPPATSPAMAARRRAVMIILAGVAAFFFVIGILPAARVLWYGAFVSLGCLAVYVALLVHFHRQAVERASKVVALETRRQASAVLESRRHVVAHERRRYAGGGGYSSGGYMAAGNYATAAGQVLGGSGWTIMGTHSHRPART